jgi:rubrerythrin
MYPGYLTEAEAAGNWPADFSFNNALAVEEIHHSPYSQAREPVQGGNDLPEARMFVCQICGNTVYGKPPEECPICRVPHTRFFEVE